MPVGQIGQRIVVREMSDLGVPRDELGPRRLHVLARLAEADAPLPCTSSWRTLKLSAISPSSSLRVRLDRHDIDRGVRGLEIAAARAQPSPARIPVSVP